MADRGREEIDMATQGNGRSSPEEEGPGGPDGWVTRPLPMGPTPQAPGHFDMTGRSGPPPGWYADPTGTSAYRYWDGHAWTPHVHPPVQPVRQPAAAPAAGTTVVVNNHFPARKSLLAAGVLTFFFGPLGMLYSTVVGALVMFLVSAVLGLVTFGVALGVTWPVQVVWAVIAAQQHNERARTHTTGWRG